MEDQDVTKLQWRKRGALCLAIIGAILLSVAVPALWVNNLASNTEAWTDTVAPLASDPAVQKELATKTSAALIDKLDVGQLAEEKLPENLKILSLPIAAAVDTLIEKETLGFLQSQRFPALWERMNTAAHKSLVALVDGGKSGIIDSASGTISLDLKELATTVSQALVDKGLTFTENLSFEKLDKSVVLVSSPALTTVQATLSFVKNMAFFLAALSAAFLLAAVLVAPKKRQGGLLVSAACAIALVVSWLLLILIKSPLVNELAILTTLGTGALGSAYDIILSPLFSLQGWFALLAALVWLVLFLLGPSRPALAAQGIAKQLQERFAKHKTNSAPLDENQPVEQELAPAAEQPEK